jgi:hypothetical protein
METTATIFHADLDAFYACWARLAEIGAHTIGQLT